MSEFVTAGGKPYLLRAKDGATKHVKLTVGRDCVTGAQIQHDYTGATAEEVQNKIDESQGLTDEQMNLRPEEITFRQLAEQYLTAKALRVEKETLRGNKGCFRQHIFPRFGDRLPRSIRQDELEAWQRQLREQGMAETRINYLFDLMSGTLVYGCRKGYLASNPCRYARVFRLVPKDQSVLSPSQTWKLLVKERDHPLAGLYAVTLLLGLRLSEATGLSWKQIDWEQKTVCVCQQGSRGRKVIPHTKTKRNRTLRMPESAVLYLRREQERQRKQAEICPGWSNPDGLVFTDEKGRMFHEDRVREALREMMDGTEGERVTTHSLRRTAASTLAENLSLHAAQYYLGHTEWSTTMRYVYPDEKDMDHLLRTMGEYYSRQLEAAGWPSGREEAREREDS